jgi:hypothetical protein
MKLTILSAIAITGLATGAFGQEILLDNLANTGAGGSTATSNGQLYETIGASTALFDGVDYNVGATVFAGSSVGSLALIGTFYPGNNNGGLYTGQAAGQFALGNAQAYAAAGVAAGGLATVEIQFWDFDNPAFGAHMYTSYAAAVGGGDATAQVTFTNPTSNAGVAVGPQELTGMPAVILAVQAVPEPATFALAGLGIASLLAFRRRK